MPMKPQVAEDDMRADLPTATDEVLRVLVARHHATNPGLTAQQITAAARLLDLETDLALVELEERQEVRIHRSTGLYVATYRGLRRDLARRARERMAPVASGYNVLARAEERTAA